MRKKSLNPVFPSKKVESYCFKELKIRHSLKKATPSAALLVSNLTELLPVDDGQT